MTTFVVEHKILGRSLIDTVTGVEDIDLTMFKDIVSLWVCDHPEEVSAIENELRAKHARHS